MRYSFVLLLWLGLWLQPLNVWAWSALGHAQIAEAAFKHLSLQEQQYFTAHAQALLNNERAKKWRQPLSAYSAFAQIAVWPDTRREKILSELFTRFGQSPVPQALRGFSNDDTKAWHYINAHYWDARTRRLLPAPSTHGRCTVERIGELDRVWPGLIIAYSELETPAAQGLVLAFILHLLADAYQPLHAMAGLNAQCQSDAGGNGYCLSPQGTRRCKHNLHRAWDKGFGAFAGAGVEISAQANPKWAFSSINQALSVSTQAARFIYSTPRYQPPNAAYEQKAGAMVERQSQLAAQALVALLHHLYEKNNEQ